MPATEQTWRNLKADAPRLRHQSLLMLGTTIWMLAADHRREWKAIPANVPRRRKPGASNLGSSSKTTTSSSASWASCKAPLAEAQHEVPPADLIDEFHNIVVEEAKDRGVAAGKFFDRSKRPIKQLQAAAERADSAPTEPDRSTPWPSCAAS